MSDDSLDLLELGPTMESEFASWMLSVDPREGEETEEVQEGDCLESPFSRSRRFDSGGRLLCV